MEKRLEDKILELVREEGVLCDTEHPYNQVPVSGKLHDERELVNGIAAVLQGWWTEGEWNDKFEAGLKGKLGAKYCATVNSGSSANLVAISALTSNKFGDRRLQMGDEVITTSAGFPTTIAPIIQNGAVPVFVDVELGMYNASPREVENAITDKTRAIVLPHTLGNPFDASSIKEIAKDNNLWFVEDNCDAFGSMYDGQITGTFGHVSTLSFYPAHHITTAEGGAVFTGDAALSRVIRSFRDWGRDCFCPTGKDNTCGKRYDWKLGDLPEGYDHKYVYSEIGYNLKMTDIQASIGVAQLDKLDDFTQKRKDNFSYLHSGMEQFKDHFILPESLEKADPSWFGFPMTIRDERIDRTEFMNYLNGEGIATRLLFSGNMIRQPAFVDQEVNYRTVGDLPNSDKIMNDTFWVGIYPRLGEGNLDYVVDKFSGYISAKK